MMDLNAIQLLDRLRRLIVTSEDKRSIRAQRFVVMTGVYFERLRGEVEVDRLRDPREYDLEPPPGTTYTYAELCNLPVVTLTVRRLAPLDWSPHAEARASAAMPWECIHGYPVLSVCYLDVPSHRWVYIDDEEVTAPGMRP